MSVVTTAPPSTRTCPKCAYVSDLAVDECPACGVVIQKVLHSEKLAETVVEPLRTGSPSSRLADAERLFVKQQIERLEMWTGIETANQYAVKDGMGRVVFDAAEESGSAGQLLGRLFLKSARPFTMHVSTTEGQSAYVMKRPFRFWFYEISVCDAHDRLLGTVTKQLSVVNRRYLLQPADGGETYEIFGPLFRPWTFKLNKNGVECGMISKKWSGLGKEMFTDSDHFGVEFPPQASVDLKALFLGAVFLIDFAHFEDNG